MKFFCNFFLANLLFTIVISNPMDDVFEGGNTVFDQCLPVLITGTLPGNVAGPVLVVVKIADKIYDDVANTP